MMRLGLRSTVDTLWMAMPRNDEFAVERDILYEDEREDQASQHSVDISLCACLSSADCESRRPSHSCNWRRCCAV